MVKKFREKETGFKDKKEKYIHWRKRQKMQPKKKKNGVEHMVWTLNQL